MCIIPTVIITVHYRYIITGTRDSVVDIATGYGLDDRGVKVRVPVSQEFSLLQTGSAANPASYSMGTGGSFPGG
jgi:hypothetical protein